MSKVRRWWVSSFPTSSLPISPTALASLACVSREFWWRQLTAVSEDLQPKDAKGVFYPLPSQPAGALIWSTDAVNVKWTWPNCIRHEMHWNILKHHHWDWHDSHRSRTKLQWSFEQLPSPCQEDSVFLRWENNSTLMHQPCTNHAPTMFQDCRFNSRGVGRGKTFRKRVLDTRKFGSFPWPRLKDSP